MRLIQNTKEKRDDLLECRKLPLKDPAEEEKIQARDFGVGAFPLLLD